MESNQSNVPQIKITVEAPRHNGGSNLTMALTLLLRKLMPGVDVTFVDKTDAVDENIQHQFEEAVQQQIDDGRLHVTDLFLDKGHQITVEHQPHDRRQS